MYRRRVKRPPTPVFGETLEELAYTIDDESHLIDANGKRYQFDLKAKDRDYQEAHGRALNDACMKVILNRMEKECDMVHATVPLGIDEHDKTSPQANILMSSNARECQRLLVLVSGTMETLGTWSRRLLSNYSVEVGSMFSTVKQARADGYGVLILNPNTQWWVDGRGSTTIPLRKDYSMIPSLASPEEHVDYVLRNFVQNFASREIFFVAHKYGAHALIQALHSQFDAFKNRVSAIAIIEGSHTIDAFPEPDFRKWWSLNAAGWVQSEVEEKGKLAYREHAGCNCIMAGTQEFDFTIVDKMPDVSRFFKARWGRDNVFEEYRNQLQPVHEDDPTTAMVAFEDMDGGDTERDGESEGE